MFRGFIKGALIGLAISLVVLTVFAIPLGVLAILKYFGAPEILEPILFLTTAIVTVCGLAGTLITYTDKNWPWI